MLQKFLLSGLMAVLLLGSSQNPQTQPQSHVQELIASLPEYSWLRTQLENGVRGEGKEQPYMERMREAGVQRALYKLTCIWHHRKPQDISVVKRVYFSKYDGPHAQIEGSTLETIRASGLEALLDRVAIDRMKEAPLFPGMDRPAIPHPEGKRMYSTLIFFDDPELPEERIPWAPWGHYPSQPLAEAASDGDASDVASLLQSHKYSQQELNTALFSAVSDNYDNSDVIDLLLKAGADINARGKFGQVPLMAALDWPIQVETLIKQGADINARDQHGRSVLELARQGGYADAVKLLQDAGARD